MLSGLSLAGLVLLAACGGPDNTPVPITSPTATAEVAATSTPTNPDNGGAPPTDTAAPAPTDTAVPPVPTDTAAPPPTDTTAPVPTDTPLVLPTVTAVVAAPTDTAAPPPTDTAAPPAPTDTAAPPPATPLPAQTDTPASGPRTWLAAARGPQQVRVLVSGPVQGGPLYAGGDGVYRTTDNGATWATLVTGFPVSSIAVAPSDPQVIYAGTGDGCHSGIPGTLRRSTDSGQTWQAVTGGPWALDVNPTNPDQVVGLQCDGVYKSTNGGQTWAKLPGTGVPNYDGATLTRGVNDRTTIYAVYASEGGTAAIQRTTDDGRTWKLLPTPDMYGLHDLAVDPKNAKHIYFVGGSGFYASADAGQTWNKLDQGLEATDASTGGYLQLSNLALDLVSPPPRNATYTIYVGSYGTSDTKPAGVFRWNGNNAWVPVAPAPNGQSITHLLVANNPKGPVLLAATDTGIYRLALR
jgi:photosystem II stability/assembly factor-like uncharacterized protein